MVWFPGNLARTLNNLGCLPTFGLGGGGSSFFAVPSGTGVIPSGADLNFRLDRGGFTTLPVAGCTSLVLGLLDDDGSGGHGLLDLSGITVEEEINGDFPLVFTGDAAAEAEDFAGEEPVHKADRVAALVVDGDGDVDVLKRRVGIAKSDDGDVHVRGLLDGLVVRAGVGDDEQTGLLELLGDLVGESTRGETSSNGGRSGVLGELEHRALAVRAGRDGADIGGVLDGSDDTGGKHDLVVGLADVEDVDVWTRSRAHDSEKESGSQAIRGPRQGRLKRMAACSPSRAKLHKQQNMARNLLSWRRTQT